MDIIGIDIGGTKCAVVIADEAGRIRQARSFPTTDAGGTLARIMAEIDHLAPGPAPLMGVSCGGPLDLRAGVILSPPNLPGWDAVPITRLLVERFGGRAHLMNDANAGALAEWRFGAARGAASVVFLTHGTGMGGGLILDGRLYEGATGDAGEVGHVRLAHPAPGPGPGPGPGQPAPVGYGKAGSVEGFTSGGGIAQLAAMRLGRTCAPSILRDLSAAPTARDVAEAAGRGDAVALEILAESGRYLGRALAILIDILNPEVIVLGSIYARSGRFLEPAMRLALAEEALPGPLAACRIVPAALGEEIGNYAAVAVALYKEGRLAQ